MLPGIDILPTPYDHIFHPSNNLSIPMLVNHCSVPAKAREWNWIPPQYVTNKNISQYFTQCGTSGPGQWPLQSLPCLPSSPALWSTHGSQAHPTNKKYGYVAPACEVAEREDVEPELDGKRQEGWEHTSVAPVRLMMMFSLYKQQTKTHDDEVD